MKRQSSPVTRPIIYPAATPLANERARVVPFRIRQATGSAPSATQGAEATRDSDTELDDFTRPEDNTTYRHRMLVNLAALVLLALLIAAGLWLADAMATLRKNEDCALSGRHDCTALDFSKRG